MKTPVWLKAKNKKLYIINITASIDPDTADIAEMIVFDSCPARGMPDATYKPVYFTIGFGKMWKPYTPTTTDLKKAVRSIFE